MSGALTHSPADIIRQLLIDLSLGTAPADSGSWPIYVSAVPDTPDSIVTVTDTTGKDDGRLMNGGERQEHHGFQIAIRAVTHAAGFTKARAIAVSIDEDVDNADVTVSSSSYVVYAISRISGVIVAGKNPPTSKRNLFTINAVVALRQV